MVVGVLAVAVVAVEVVAVGVVVVLGAVDEVIKSRSFKNNFLGKKFFFIIYSR